MSTLPDLALPPIAHELARTKALAVVSTLFPDGAVQSTPVWWDIADGRVRFNTVRGRTKERNMRRAGQVSFTVVDPDDQWRWFSVSGTPEFPGGDALAHIHELSQRYLGSPYPWFNPAQPRLLVVVTPTRQPLWRNGRD